MDSQSPTVEITLDTKKRFQRTEEVEVGNAVNVHLEVEIDRGTANSRCGETRHPHLSETSIGKNCSRFESSTQYPLPFWQLPTPVESAGSWTNPDVYFCQSRGCTACGRKQTHSCNHGDPDFPARTPRFVAYYRHRTSSTILSAANSKTRVDSCAFPRKNSCSQKSP